MSFFRLTAPVLRKHAGWCLIALSFNSEFHSSVTCCRSPIPGDSQLSAQTGTDYFRRPIVTKNLPCPTSWRQPLERDAGLLGKGFALRSTVICAEQGQGGQMGPWMKHSPVGTLTGGQVPHVCPVSSLLHKGSHITPGLPSELQIHHLLEPLPDLYIVSLLPLSPCS